MGKKVGLMKIVTNPDERMKGKEGGFMIHHRVHAAIVAWL